MAGTGHRTVVATCVCGSAALELIGAPIMTVGCYCDSCREAAEVLGDRMNAPPMTEDDGATHFVIQRKDRVRCTRGDAILREHRLTGDSKTSWRHAATRLCFLSSTQVTGCLSMPTGSIPLSVPPSSNAQ